LNHCQKIPFDLLERLPCGRGSGDDNQVQTSRELMLMQAKHLTQEAPGAVANHGPAYPRAGNHPETTNRPARHHPPISEEAADGEPAALLFQAGEFAAPGDPGATAERETG
jgi:hypothetical protein